MLYEHNQFAAYNERYVVLPVWEQNAVQRVNAYYIGVFVGSSVYSVVQFQKPLLVFEQGSENRIFVFALGWHKGNIENRFYEITALACRKSANYLHQEILPFIQPKDAFTTLQASIIFSLSFSPFSFSTPLLKSIP